MAERDAPLAQIIGGQLQSHTVTGKNTDEIFFHAAGRVGNQTVAVLQFDAISAVRKDFLDHALHLYEVFFRH